MLATMSSRWMVDGLGVQPAGAFRHFSITFRADVAALRLPGAAQAPLSPCSKQLGIALASHSPESNELGLTGLTRLRASIDRL